MPSHPILSYPISSHPTPPHPIACHPIPSHPAPSYAILSLKTIPSHPIPSHPTLHYPFLSYVIPSHPILSYPIQTHAIPSRAIHPILSFNQREILFVAAFPALFSVENCTDTSFYDARNRPAFCVWPRLVKDRNSLTISISAKDLSFHYEKLVSLESLLSEGRQKWFRFRWQNWKQPNSTPAQCCPASHSSRAKKAIQKTETGYTASVSHM